MEKQVKMTSVVVGILGIISVATGFAAEIHRIKESDLEYPYEYECVYPSSPSPVLGVIAAACLVLARIVLVLAGGCQKYSEYPNVTSLVHSMFSWIASIVAVALLLAGAITSIQREVDVKSDGTFSCYVVRPGLFAGGAILSFAGVFFGIIFYLNFSSAKKSSSEKPTGVNININDIQKP